MVSLDNSDSSAREPVLLNNGLVSAFFPVVELANFLGSFLKVATKRLKLDGLVF